MLLRSAMRRCLSISGTTCLCSAMSTLRAAEVTELEAKRQRDEAAAEGRILAGTVRQLQEECLTSKVGSMPTGGWS